MKQFAVAFTTTGNSPKEGHRFSEIVVVRQKDGSQNGQRAKFKLNVDSASDQQMTFPVVLEAMKALVGDAAVIVHDAGNWRRFLRVELKNIKRHGADNLLNNVVEVRAWAHQRFPRQRKDVVAIAKKAGIEVPADLSGLELEAELLCRIGNLMTEPTKTSPAAVAQAIKQPTGRNWIESAGKFWRNLTGRA
jgi:hypothetical protein